MNITHIQAKQCNGCLHVLLVEVELVNACYKCCHISSFFLILILMIAFFFLPLLYFTYIPAMYINRAVKISSNQTAGNWGNNSFRSTVHLLLYILFFLENYVRLFAIFVATPKDENQRPKTLPDFESAVSGQHYHINSYMIFCLLGCSVGVC